MGKSKNVEPGRTSDVREFFANHPDLVPEGDKTVGAAAAGRGRVSAQAKAIFTEQTGRPFVEGDAAAKVVNLTYVHTQPSGRKVKRTAQVTPSQLRALVPNAPQRGVLSRAHIEAAGEAYAAQVQAARATEAAEATA